MFKRDSYVFGVILALSVSVVSFGLIYLSDRILFNMQLSRSHVALHYHLIGSIFINLIPMRIYLVNLKMDRTGRAILLCTFVMGIAFFILRLYLKIL